MLKILRLAEVNDVNSVLQLFRDCVLTVCRHDYSAEQLNAWCSSAENRSRWINKIENQFFILALKNETIVGFGALNGSDTIDMLYVHKDFQRLAVGEELLRALCTRAEQLGAKELKAEVSKTAKGFFESKGFNVIASQSKEIDGVLLENFRMVKNLINQS